MIYFIGNCMFGSKRALEMFKRPFASVQEMDRVMVERWNGVVKADGDRVVVVGEFARGPVPYLKELRAKLNGEIWYVVPHQSMCKRYYTWINRVMDRVYNQRRLMSASVPAKPTFTVLATAKYPRGVHNSTYLGPIVTPYQNTKYFSVSADLHNYEPVSKYAVYEGTQALLQVQADQAAGPVPQVQAEQGRAGGGVQRVQAVVQDGAAQDYLAASMRRRAEQQQAFDTAQLTNNTEPVPGEQTDAWRRYYMQVRNAGLQQLNSSAFIYGLPLGQLEAQNPPDPPVLDQIGRNITRVLNAAGERVLRFDAPIIERTPQLTITQTGDTVRVIERQVLDPTPVRHAMPYGMRVDRERIDEDRGE